MMQYSERVQYCSNSVAEQLLRLMDRKQTNLALSADVSHFDKLLMMADKLGPEICVLKTHIDIVEGFEPRLIKELRKLAGKHEFLIFEDRKFADIGHTAKLQYQAGTFRIVEWADMINAHGLPGPGIVQGLAEVGLQKQRALLLLAEMSSENNLFNPVYTQKILEMATQFPQFVIGFIAQHKLNEDPRWLYFTPGVRFSETKDALGQHYVSPETAILDHGTDVIIVGRGIINADDPLGVARRYREAGWNAYLKRNNS